MKIDLTKKYITRQGHEVRNLRPLPEPDDWYVFVGDILYEDGDIDPDETWTADGKFIASQDESGYDLVLAPNQEPARPGLAIPDPLLVEYGRFVAAVQINFANRAFETATPDEFESWLAELTPSFRKP